MGRSVTPLTQQIAELEIWTAAMGLLDASELRLYAYPNVPTQLTTYGAMLGFGPAYTGYFPQVLTGWFDAGTDPNGLAVVPAESIQFAPTGVVASAEVGGYWVTWPGPGAGFAFAVPFPAPVSMGVTGLEELTFSATLPFRQQGVIVSYAFQVAALEVLTGAMGNLDLNLVKLFKFGYNPSELSTIAELDAQQCDFTGYMSQAIADWNEAGTDIDGEVVVTADTLQFLATGTAVANNVGGYYVTSADGLTLKFCVAFDVPVPMGVTGFEQLPVQAEKTWGR